MDADVVADETQIKAEVYKGFIAKKKFSSINT